MKSTINFFVILITVVGILLTSCSGDSSQDPTVDQVEEVETAVSNEHDPDEEGRVHLTPLQMETAGIETGSIQQLALENTIKVNGYLELPPQNQANVSAIFGGLVQRIYVREGDIINAGETLADLSGPVFLDLQADYRRIVSNLEYLGEDYRRKERLLNDDVGSRSDFQKARADYLSAVAEMESLESKLRMIGLDENQILEGNMYETVPLKAPIGGFVRLVEVNTGQYAEPNQDLFEIVDNEHIHIDLLVYEKDIHKVSVDQKVLFRYTNQPSGQFYEARVFSVGKAFEDNPRAVRVHAEIEDHQEGLLPGMFVDGRIITEMETLVVLPNEAIVRNGDEYLVFMAASERDVQDNVNGEANEEMEFIVIPVRTGLSDAGYTEVLFFEPIPENSSFVTTGAYFLLAEMRKGEGGHDH